MQYLKLPLFLLPYVTPSNRHKLPKASGIYYVTQMGQVRYVGKSVNMRSRWIDHQKLDYMHGPGWRISYRRIPFWLIDGREWEEIKAHAPRGHHFPALNQMQGYRPRWWWMVQTIDFLADSAILSLLFIAIYFASRIF
jgi:hypothetical protein